ncbi:kinase-like domain-containing protein [Rhizophagus irregularis DAOM 181602=DAOM 197198]|nr:kinase-like domain-containing protein [Rhizophagus irregularis DAOM 181602=DAOM 197198]
MSDNIIMHDTDEWIKEAINKEHIKYYEYSEFSDFKEIGSGVTLKEIVCELKIQREVDYHDNIIRCHGITKFESAEYHGNNNYILVMEYADGGSLRNYLKENFINLTWDDKSIMAYQLSCAISCLHNEGIVHRDLHSDEQYDVGLALEILQGLRETVVPGTPENYAKIYTECWDGEPDNRPTINQVVTWLNALIIKTDVIIENHQVKNKQELNEAISLSANNSEPRGELSQLMQNFEKMKIDTKKIDSFEISENLSTEKDFNMIVGEINDYIYKLKNKGNYNISELEKHFNNYNASLQEIYNCTTFRW